MGSFLELKSLKKSLVNNANPKNDYDKSGHKVSYVAEIFLHYQHDDQEERHGKKNLQKSLCGKQTMEDATH